RQGDPGAVLGGGAVLRAARHPALVRGRGCGRQPRRAAPLGSRSWWHLPRQGAGRLPRAAGPRAGARRGRRAALQHPRQRLGTAPRHLPDRDRGHRCGRYPLRRSRRRSPGPGDAAAAAAAPGARPGADRVDESVRGRPRRQSRPGMALGGFAGAVRRGLHRHRSRRVRLPLGGLVTSSDAPAGTGSTGTRVLGLVTLAGIALGAYLALVASPQDENMGDAVRLLYLHVPIVTMAYVGCGLCTLASAIYLWK